MRQRIVDAPAPIHCDEPYACLNQTTRKEQTVAVFMPAVSIADTAGFRLTIEGAARLLRGQERKGPLLVAIKIIDGPCISMLAHAAVHAAQQNLPILHARRLDSLVQAIDNK